MSGREPVPPEGRDIRPIETRVREWSDNLNLSQVRGYRTENRPGEQPQAQELRIRQDEERILDSFLHQVPAPRNEEVAEDTQNRLFVSVANADRPGILRRRGQTPWDIIGENHSLVHIRHRDSDTDEIVDTRLSMPTVMATRMIDLLRDNANPDEIVDALNRPFGIPPRRESGQNPLNLQETNLTERLNPNVPARRDHIPYYHADVWDFEEPEPSFDDTRPRPDDNTRVRSVPGAPLTDNLWAARPNQQPPHDPLSAHLAEEEPPMPNGLDTAGPVPGETIPGARHAAPRTVPEDPTLQAEPVARVDRNRNPNDAFRDEMQNLLDGVDEHGDPIIRDTQVQILLGLAIDRGMDLDMLMDLLDKGDKRALSTNPDTVINFQEWRRVQQKIVARIAQLRQPAHAQAPEPHRPELPPDLAELMQAIGGAGGRRERMAELPQPYTRAIFNQGNYGNYADYWGDNVVRCDVTKERKENEDGVNGREEWAFTNMSFFEKGMLPQIGIVEQAWLMMDLTPATEKATRGKTAAEKRRIENEIKKTEELLKAMIAVTVAARAMEQSEGSPKDYVATVTFGDPEAKGKVKEYLLADHPEKLKMLVGAEGGNIRVRNFFYTILSDAGLSGYTEWRDRETPSQISVNVEDARIADRINPRTGRFGLSHFLKNKAENGGKEAYIDTLLGNNVDPIDRVAANLAFDAFMVDIYTRWQAQVDFDGDLKIQPNKDWQGDPFRAIIEPAFMPDKIKKVYQSPYGKRALGLVNYGLAAPDILQGPLAEKALPPSAVGGLSNFNRFSECLSLVIGDNMASGLSQINEKRKPDLVKVANNLDQMFGKIKGEGPNGDPLLGKKIAAAMFTRLVEAMVTAQVIQSAAPGMAESLHRVRRNKEDNPYYNTVQMLWGQGYIYGQVPSSGLFVELKQANGFIYRSDQGNPYGAQGNIDRTQALLETNDQGRVTLRRR